MLAYEHIFLTHGSKYKKKTKRAFFINMVTRWAYCTLLNKHFVTAHSHLKKYEICSEKFWMDCKWAKPKQIKVFSDIVDVVIFVNENQNFGLSKQQIKIALKNKNRFDVNGNV